LARGLVWLTLETATLKNHRDEYEYQVQVRLAGALPADINMYINADRGFGDSASIGETETSTPETPPSGSSVPRARPKTIKGTSTGTTISFAHGRDYKGMERMTA
jgi:hypothetical protein